MKLKGIKTQSRYTKIFLFIVILLFTESCCFLSGLFGTSEEKVIEYLGGVHKANLTAEESGYIHGCFQFCSLQYKELLKPVCEFSDKLGTVQNSQQSIDSKLNALIQKMKSDLQAIEKDGVFLKKAEQLHNAILTATHQIAFLGTNDAETDNVCQTFLNKCSKTFETSPVHLNNLKTFLNDIDVAQKGAKKEIDLLQKSSKNIPYEINAENLYSAIIEAATQISIVPKAKDETIEIYFNFQNDVIKNMTNVSLTLGNLSNKLDKIKSAHGGLKTEISFLQQITNSILELKKDSALLKGCSLFRTTL